MQEFGGQSCERVLVFTKTRINSMGFAGYFNAFESCAVAAEKMRRNQVQMPSRPLPSQGLRVKLHTKIQGTPIVITILKSTIAGGNNGQKRWT